MCTVNRASSACCTTHKHSILLTKASVDRRKVLASSIFHGRWFHSNHSSPNRRQNTSSHPPVIFDSRYTVVRPCYQCREKITLSTIQVQLKQNFLSNNEEKRPLLTERVLRSFLAELSIRPRFYGQRRQNSPLLMPVRCRYFHWGRKKKVMSPF